jgi:hypothetical protein
LKQFQEVCFLCQSLKHSASFHQTFLPLIHTEQLGNAFVIFMENIIFCPGNDNCFKCQCNSSESYFLFVEDCHQKMVFHFTESTKALVVFIVNQYFDTRVLGYLPPKDQYKCIQGSCHGAYDFMFEDIKKMFKSKAKKNCSTIPPEWRSNHMSEQLKSRCLLKPELCD